MKRAALALVLGGCLTPPDAPPGGNQELRHTTIVRDVDGDGYDDLVTIGHDGDPRQDAYLFIDYGSSSRPLARGNKQSLRIDTDGDFDWYEATGVAWFTSANPSLTGLYVVTGQDAGVPPGGDNTRYNYITYLPITGRTIGTPAYSLHLQADGLGGYLYDHPANVCARDRQQGGAHVIFGSDGEWWSDTLPLDASEPELHTSLSGIDSAAGVEGLFALPSSLDVTEPPIVLTRDEAIVFSPTEAMTMSGGPKFTIGQSTMLKTFGNQRDVRLGQVGAAAWLAGNNDDGDSIALASYDGGVLSEFQLDASTGSAPSDVEVVDLDGTGDVDVVTLEGGDIYVYAKPALVADQEVESTASNPLKQFISGSAYDLLAIGHFQDITGEPAKLREIYALSSTMPTLPRMCFYVDHTAQFQPCPGGP